MINSLDYEIEVLIPTLTLTEVDNISHKTPFPYNEFASHPVNPVPKHPFSQQMHSKCVNEAFHDNKHQPPARTELSKIVSFNELQSNTLAYHTDINLNLNSTTAEHCAYIELQNTHSERGSSSTPVSDDISLALVLPPFQGNSSSYPSLLTSAPQPLSVNMLKQMPMGNQNFNSIESKRKSRLRNEENHTSQQIDLARSCYSIRTSKIL